MRRTPRRRGRRAATRTGPRRPARGRTRPCRSRKGRAPGARAACDRAAPGPGATVRGARERASMESLREGHLDAVAHLLQSAGSVDQVEAPRMLAGALEIGIAHAREELGLLALELVGRVAARPLAPVGSPRITAEEKSPAPPHPPIP